MQVPADMEIAYIPCTSAGSYPGLYLATTPSRFIRNVKQMFGDGSLELIGPLEQVSESIFCIYTMLYCPSAAALTLEVMVSSQAVDLFFSLELYPKKLGFLQAYMEIKCPGGNEVSGPNYIPTHEEINATAFLSVVANLTPWSDHNQSPRNMYQCQVLAGARPFCS